MLVSRVRRAACGVVALLSLAVSPEVLAVEATPSATTRELILSRLPAPDTADYRALKRAAGQPESEALEMTAAEVWSVAGDRVDDLKAAAATRGVNVVHVAKPDSVFMPMAPSAAMTDQQTAMMHNAMALPAALGVAIVDLPHPSVMEHVLTKGLHHKNRQAHTDVTLMLDASTSVTVKRTSVEKTDGGYVWHGAIIGTEEPVTLLWWPTGRLAGQITYKGRHFVLKNLGGTMHGIVEMSPRKLPPEHAPMGKSLMRHMRMQRDPLVTQGDASMLRRSDAEKIERPQEPLRNPQDSVPAKRTKPGGTEIALVIPAPAALPQRMESVAIDLIVAYTRQAASRYTDIRRDLIEVAIEEANQSFRNSGVDNAGLHLVHAYETDYVEAGTHFEHVFRFADKGDGYMDEVHALRDRYKADVAILIVHDPNGCGLSAAVAPPADRAFAVVHHECAALSYSLAHEIGHIIGARHDVGLDDGNHPYPYGHGYVHGKDWRTMMGYEESCNGCPRLPIWSSPLIKVGGAPAGNSMSDNARVIAEGAARVAAFR